MNPPWRSVLTGATSPFIRLGTLEDFKRFVRKAETLGLEVALDLAYQCSPDHPYVKNIPMVPGVRMVPFSTRKPAEKISKISILWISPRSMA